MTKTQDNWPDPKRPGVPMFPERDGAHAFEMEEYPGFVVWEWSAKNKEYSGISYEAEIVYSPAEMACEYKYCGPVLTTTQIKEMLAAERERCAKTCEAEQIPDFSMPEQWHNNGCKHSARAIRNLGDAP